MRDKSREIYTGPVEYGRLPAPQRLAALFRLKFATYVHYVDEWPEYDRLLLTNAQDPARPYRHTREFDLKWHVDGRQFMSVHVPRTSPEDSPPYVELLLDAGPGLAVRPTVFVHGSLQPWLAGHQRSDVVRSTNTVVDAVTSELAAADCPLST